MSATNEGPVFETNPILVSATQIISAHLGNNPVALPDVPGFIRTVFSTLVEMEHDHHLDGSSHHGAERTEGAEGHGVPAVSIDASVRPDYIVCLEDGKKLRMLKRYLMAQYGMTPQQYRTKWGLPDDYPMVAQVVSDQRRRAAKDNGLGRPPAKRQAVRKPRKTAH